MEKLDGASPIPWTGCLQFGATNDSMNKSIYCSTLRGFSLVASCMMSFVSLLRECLFSTRLPLIHSTNSRLGQTMLSSVNSVSRPYLSMLTLYCPTWLYKILTFKWHRMACLQVPDSDHKLPDWFLFTMADKTAAPTTRHLQRLAVLILLQINLEWLPL
jgi:hypothetical protein